MPLISQIENMRRSGMNDSQVNQTLAEQGFSPLEITQALEQSKIKSVVSQLNPEEQQEEYIPSGEEKIGESIQPSAVETQEQVPQEQIQEQIPEEQAPQEQVQYQEYAPQQQYSTYSSNSDMMAEIAESLIEEKTLNMRKTMQDLSNFKLIAKKKLEILDERLKRIEELIDKMQMNIIGKVGNYGKSLEEIKQEMGMMQESFTKGFEAISKKKVKK